MNSRLVHEESESDLSPIILPGVRRMPDYNDEILYQADNQEDARYVEISCAAFGCKVTKGQIYKLERNFNNPYIFERGEAYIVDDETKDNYSVFLLCKTVLYK